MYIYFIYYFRFLFRKVHPLKIMKPQIAKLSVVSYPPTLNNSSENQTHVHTDLMSRGRTAFQSRIRATSQRELPQPLHCPAKTEREDFERV